MNRKAFGVSFYHPETTWHLMTLSLTRLHLKKTTLFESAANRPFSEMAAENSNTLE